MYKILIKYKSTFGKTFWYFHTVEQDGETVEYSSYNTDDIEKEMKKLDMIYGYENLRVIIDITSDLEINVSADPKVDTTTSEDIDDIYETAYKNVFSE